MARSHFPRSLLFLLLATSSSIWAAGAPLTPVADQPQAHIGEVRALATTTSGLVSGGEDGMVKLWELGAYDLLLLDESQQDHEIYDVEASADGRLVAVGEGGWNGGPSSDTFKVFDASSLQLEFSTTPGGFVYCVAISPDNGKVAGSGFYGELFEYSLDGETPPVLLSEEKIGKRTGVLRYSDDGMTLASGSIQNGEIYLWNVNQLPFEELSSVSADPSTWSFPMDLSGTLLAAASGGENLSAWDITDPTFPTLLFDVGLGLGSITAVAISPDGTMIATGGSNGGIKVVDATEGTVVYEKGDAHGNSDVLAVAWIDNSSIASGSSDGFIKVWRLAAVLPPPPPPPGPSGCDGLVDTKGSDFCARKADTWCPPAGSTVQCDLTCCCRQDPDQSNCPP